MFDYISGRLAQKAAGYAVVDVGGVGYRILTSGRSLSGVGDTGGAVTFYTYLHVREDIFDLFGFSTAEERATFELLISVSGVGPKAALNILSALTAQSLAIAIATNDSKAITAAQGVGPKLAQRIILELKDKIKKEHIAGGVQFEPINENSLIGEAAEALVVLGYAPSDAARAVQAVGEGLSLEETIKTALKILLKN